MTEVVEGEVGYIRSFPQPALNPLAHTFIAMELVMAIFEIPLNRQS